MWASSDTEAGDAKPVMVWLHGGAYILGSSAQSLYHGGALAGSGDAVIVTVNYRLGALGFLDLSSLGDGFDTNLGLRDVLFALQWVRDNIAGFGGDPDRVTLFGESAGAGMVTTLMASPAAAGLFSAAIAQSSPATSIYDRDRGRRAADMFLDALGVGRDDAKRLTGLPIEAVLAASKRVFDEVPVRTPGTLAFAPIIDGDIVPAHPVRLAREGRTHPVPLIIGTNKHEAALFRWMKSPLMPITPKAIRTMFTEIAAEQPACSCRAKRRSGPPTGAAPRPSAWAWPATSASGCRRSGSPRAIATSRRCTSTASTSRPRCCACCAWAPRTPPSCRTCGAISSPGPRTRRSNWAG